MHIFHCIRLKLWITHLIFDDIGYMAPMRWNSFSFFLLQWAHMWIHWTPEEGEISMWILWPQWQTSHLLLGHMNCFIMEWTHLPICLHNCLVLHEWDLSQVPNVFVSMRLFSLIPQGFEWNTKPGSLALQKLLVPCTHLRSNGISLCLGLCIECKLWALGDQVKGHKRKNRICRALRPYCGELLVLWFQVF